MRFLKNKILRAQQGSKTEEFDPPEPSTGPKSNEEILEKLEELSQECSSLDEVSAFTTTKKRKRGSRKSVNPSKKRRIPSSTKNIALNYGKAISSFAISNLAQPYLQDSLDKEGVKLHDFIDFVNRKKSKIGGISSFRPLLLTSENDDPKTVAFKRIFQWIGEVFIKCFSVNWIIHGKVSHKLTYLKYRFKMLRRIQHPEKFTFVKERQQLQRQFN